MERIWLDNYPPGVPREIDANRFASLTEILAWAGERFPERDAFTNQGTAIKYGELRELSEHFAAYLQHVTKLSRGDRVAIILPNLLQYPVALFGVLLAGGVVVNTNPLYTARELQHQLADSGATVAIVLENFAHTLEQVLENTQVRHVIVTGVGDMLGLLKGPIVNLAVKYLRHMVPAWHIAHAVTFPEALAAGSRFGLERAALRPEDIAFLQYTGGTTGVPKGAVLTHGNVVANVEQTVAWMSGVMNEGEELVVIPLPLYHIFAMMAMFAFMRLGATSLLITNPRDIPQFIKELKHTRLTVMIGVNTLFNALLNAADIGEVKADALKLVIAGGMAVQRPVAERWLKVFGTQMIEGYGLTECSPIVCANPLNISGFTGCIGLPLPSTDVAICDDADHELPIGEVGEIFVRGPQVMRGYWNRPDETRKVLTTDGWLRTGDIGLVDARGYVKLVDRKKDVIIVSGFKVFPNEVEEVVAMHAGVFEVAAISAVDERSEQAVKIVVVRKDPNLTAEEIAAHCRKYLTAYKVPRYIVFRDGPLPKSNIGKILRRLVQDEENRPLPEHAEAQP
jgi:long-chain acyl-CoA synthetase